MTGENLEEAPQLQVPSDLLAILQSDYSTEERRKFVEMAAADPDDVLADFLASAVPWEEVEERRRSSENIELGHRVEGLLSPAPVTRSFKRHIAEIVRDAHALQRPVNEYVSLQDLGLDSGTGIYDPQSAPTLEATYLKSYAANFLKHISDSFPVIIDEDRDPVPLPENEQRQAKLIANWTWDYFQTFNSRPYEPQLAEELAYAVSLRFS